MRFRRVRIGPDFSLPACAASGYVDLPMTRHRILVRSIVWGVLIWAPIASLLSCAMTILLPSVFLVGRDNTTTIAHRVVVNGEEALPFVLFRAWGSAEVQWFRAWPTGERVDATNHPDLEPWMIDGDELGFTPPPVLSMQVQRVYGFGWPRTMMYAMVDQSGAVRGGRQLGGRVFTRYRILPELVYWPGIAASVPIHLLLWATPIALIEAWRYRCRFVRHECPRCKYQIIPRDMRITQIPGCPECGLGYETTPRVSERVNQSALSGKLPC